MKHKRDKIKFSNYNPAPIASQCGKSRLLLSLREQLGEFGPLAVNLEVAIAEAAGIGGGELGDTPLGRFRVELPLEL